MACQIRNEIRSEKCDNWSANLHRQLHVLSPYIISTNEAGCESSQQGRSMFSVHLEHISLFQHIK